MHRGLYHVFRRAEPADEVFLVLVILVPDLAYDLLQHVLQRDQSGRRSVFIQHNSDIVLGLPKLHH